MSQSVTFPNRSANIAAVLYVPPNFDAGTKYPAIICGHPISSCKEQTASIYAQKLAALGFVTLAFDASHQGERRRATLPRGSGIARRGLPLRGRLSDDARLRRRRAYRRAGHLRRRRLCGQRSDDGAPDQGGRHRRRGQLWPLDARRRHVGRRGARNARRDRQAAYRRGARRRSADRHLHSRVGSRAQQAGVNDIDIVEAVDYYTTPRGQQPGSPNKLRFSGLQAAVGFDAFHLAEQLLTQPLQIVIGSRPGAFGSYRDGYELFERARSSRKNLFVVEGASHYDLYDKPEYVEQAMAKLGPFFQENLGAH